MGKNLVSILFLVISGLAVYLFMQRDDRTLREQVSGQEKQPRITLEEFTLHRYRNHTVLSTLTGRIGNFMDPNVLEMYGNLRGLRYDSPSREYFSAESATIYFESNGIVQLLNDSEISRAEIENNVNVGTQDKLLKTQYARYNTKKGMLRSDVPVTFVAPNSIFKGTSGFEYNIATEDVVLFGPIEEPFRVKAYRIFKILLLVGFLTPAYVSYSDIIENIDDLELDPDSKPKKKISPNQLSQRLSPPILKMTYRLRRQNRRKTTVSPGKKMPKNPLNSRVMDNRPTLELKVS